MSVIIDIDLSTKRISKRQVNRANPDPNLSVEEYHKVTVFIPYLDFFIQQLEERFSIHSEIFEGTYVKLNHNYSSFNYTFVVSIKLKTNHRDKIFMHQSILLKSNFNGLCIMYTYHIIIFYRISKSIFLYINF